MIYVYEAGPYEQAELIQIVHPIHQWILWTQLRLLHHYIIILYYSLNALLYSQLNIYNFFHIKESSKVVDKTQKTISISCKKHEVIFYMKHQMNFMLNNFQKTIKKVARTFCYNIILKKVCR